MHFTLTAIVGIDPRFKFGSAQQPIRFRHGPLAMDPCRFNGVEPRTFARQRAHDKAHACSTPLDLLMVVPYPVPHRLAAVPRGIVPDQQQGGEALCREACGAPRQEIDRDGTHGAPRDKAEPHLVRLVWPRPDQPAITGQRLGIRIVRRRRQLLDFGRGLGVCPAMLVGLSEPTPPDFVATPQRPSGLGSSPLDQPVTPVFFLPL
jgi:hypothetical protein